MTVTVATMFGQDLDVVLSQPHGGAQGRDPAAPSTGQLSGERARWKSFAANGFAAEPVSCLLFPARARGRWVLFGRRSDRAVTLGGDHRCLVNLQVPTVADHGPCAQLSTYSGVSFLKFAVAMHERPWLPSRLVFR